MANRFPKLKGMMPNLPRNAMPAAPRVGNPAMGMPKAPTMMAQPSSAPFAAPSAVAPRLSLPSIQTTANQATPIELGDPKRLAKIATILRMGRK
jgi:hypothetical protein